MKHLQLRSLSPLLPTLLLTPLAAQVQHEPDFDRSRLPLQTLGANQGSNYVVSSVVTLTPGRYEITAPLVVAAGGELRVRNCEVSVVGDITLQEGGRIHVADGALGVKNTFQAQYTWWLLGGMLCTDRATIGAAMVPGGPFPCAIWLNNGTWYALDTTLRAGGVLQGFGRQGFLGRPEQRGGTLRAKRLLHGERADFIHLCGLGDTTLEDSAFPIALYIYGDGSAPASTTLDFNPHSTRAHDVFGDPAVHTGVTRPVPFMPCRLELNNCRVPSWVLSVNEVRDGGQPYTVTLANADALLISVQATNLVGSPVYGGNWSQYYGRLPGLPSTRAPGWHPMPPDCSVRLGNCTFRTGSGAGDWAHIEFWGVYLTGAGTDYTIRGPVALGEVFVKDGRLQLLGDGSFDMGLLCNVIDLTGGARVTVDDAALGEFGTGHTLRGLVNARDSATCTIRRSRISDLRLMTWNSGATIDVGQSFVEGALTQDNGRGGTIRVTNAQSGQDTDLQNLDFEGALQSNGLPAFWTGASAAGVSSTDRWTRSGGSRSYELRATGFPGEVRKSLSLPPETFVDVVGAVNLLQTPPTGAFVTLATTGSGGAYTSVVPTAATGWRMLQIPTFQVGFADTTTRILFRGEQFAVQARLDDWRILLGSWWDNHHLGNLDFEQPIVRDSGLAPQFFTAPDGWKGYMIKSTVDTANRRPGSSGSRSARLALQGVAGDMFKDFTFLRPGDRVQVTGWVKGPITSMPYAKVGILMGEGFSFYVNNGVNQQAYLPSDGAWHSLTLNYTVPTQRQAFTRLDVNCYTGPGSVVYVDDLSVRVQ